MTTDPVEADATRANELLYEIKDGVGVVTLNRPQARNALTIPMYERLAEICETIPTDGSVHALIITGAGDKAFAAGTDISHFHDFSTPEQGLAYEAAAEANVATYDACPVPVIAAISGACTGGGAGIAACCDLRLATRSLKFGFPIARTLGNCLSASTLYRLVALIGEARTKDLLLTSRLMLAEEALATGLVNEVLEDHAALMARAFELAATLKGHAPLTIRATKVLLSRIRDHGPAAEDADWIGRIYASDDFKEGREAFLAKRKPAWRGR
ncbi:MAG: enoyl-CoA hydratase/isomerase family protein [Pseudomonadota bacterium]